MGMEEISESVEITVKTIGPAPPSLLSVSTPIKVRDLRKLIATSSANHLPIENLRLIFRGKVLEDTQDDDDRDDVYLQLSNGDSVIAAVKPKPPAKHLRDGTYIDDDDLDLKFKLPQSTSRWKRKLFFFLRNKLKLPGKHRRMGAPRPGRFSAMIVYYILMSQLLTASSFDVVLIDILLMVIFSLSLKTWAIIILWFVFAPIAHGWDLGPLYILGTAFCIIFLNLGQRQPGDMSAYSIFNDDFRELPGTLNADRLDRDIRAGQI